MDSDRETYLERLKRVNAESAAEVETYPDWCKALLKEHDDDPS